MPDLEYFVVAESFAVDRDTSAISIFNVLSELVVEGFPFSIPKAVALSCWICSGEEISANANLQAQIAFSVPGDPHPLKHTGNFVAGSRFQNVVLEVPGLNVSRAGDIIVDLAINGEHKARHLIEVKQQATE